VNRRSFITLIGGAAAWPSLTARAQQPAMPVVGFLSARSPGESASAVGAFRQALGQLGYFEGKNFTIEYRWAEGQYDRLPELAAELVRRQVAVIAATGGEVSGVAAKTATTTIPIVFTIGGDGFGAFEFSIAGKWVQGLKELVPSATEIAVIVNPETAPFYGKFLPFIDTAARLAEIKPNITAVHDPVQIAGTIDKLARESNAGLIVLPGAQFTTAKELIIATAARLRLPAMYPYTYWVKSGGLISYGFDAQDMYRRAASYVDRILRGARVQELPVQNPVKFELAINFKTAKALGLSVPDKLLALADEVIE
jgi:ABC-type uncharacterized transport system substrate-binding protein